MDTLSHQPMARGMNKRQFLGAGGLYLVTPDRPDDGRLIDEVAALLPLGVAMLQLRNKSASDAARRRQAERLLALCRQYQVPLVINDDWRLALAVGADGVHLGRDDDDPGEVRLAAGEELVIGVSCYGDICRAQRAAALGADYLAFGAMFASATKPQAPVVPLEVLRSAQELALPTVAIGGITPDNAYLPLSAGARFIAVVGAVFDAPDPAAAMCNFMTSFREHKK